MLDASKVFLGIAPIGWTNDDMPELGAENTFQQCISEMALAGFTCTEIGRQYPTDPDVLKKALDLRGMKIASRWFSSYLLEESYERNEERMRQSIEFVAKVGAKRINVCEQSYSIQGKLDQPVHENKPVLKTDEEWKRLADGLNRLGKVALEDYGFKICLHHHMGTVVQTAEETERIMDMTDPRYVFLCYDTGHFAFAGVDPAEMAKKYVSRIGHVHLKDMRKEVVQMSHDKKWCFLDCVRNGCFTIPSDGCIDFEPIFETLDKGNYEGCILVEAEQDPAKANPFEYALRVRKYIKERTGL